MSTIISYFIGLVLLIIVLKIIALPLKIIIRFIFNSLIGGICLGVCAFFGFGINIYWWTVVLTGLFGLPGFLFSLVVTCII